MSRYTDAQLRSMAKQVLEIRTNRDPREMHDLLTFMVVARRSLETN